MSNFDELLRNNVSFARSSAKDRVPEIPFIPNKQVYILTCIDPRVDPAQVFGLQLGDAIVFQSHGDTIYDTLAAINPKIYPDRAKRALGIDPATAAKPKGKAG